MNNKYMWIVVAVLLTGLIIFSIPRAEAPKDKTANLPEWPDEISKIQPQVDRELIKLASDPWMPFNGEPTAERPGYIIEILKKIFPEAAYDLQIQNRAWSWVIKSVETGEIDAAIAADHVNNPTFIFPTESVGVQVFGLFVKKDTAWRYDGKESLGKIKLGCMQDYSYNPVVDAHITKKKGVYFMTGTDGLSRGIKMLMNSRHDVFIGEVKVFQMKLHELKIDPSDIELIHTFPPSSPLHIGFSPANPEQSKKWALVFSKGIAAMRKNGELQKILDRYKIKDWVE